MKISTKTQNIITQTGRWLVFIVTWVTMTIKIVEVSAYNSMQIIIQNPDFATSSSLVVRHFF
jgi:hypothetical protein